MTVAELRRGRNCLQPVRIGHVADDPEAVRELVRRNGPYFFPDRPGGLVWPTWHAQWASNGRLHLEGARELFESATFLDAAREMCGTESVTPRSLYVNLGTPFIAQPVSHTDMPEFRGVDEQIAPGWFLQSMGASGLFEDARIEVVTAVSWFFRGEHGGFRYWPGGRGEDSVLQADTWNTAVMGDNNFMHHKVEKIGPAGIQSPRSMTSAATLDFEGEQWIIRQQGKVLEHYPDDQVRLSLSWTGRVEEDSTSAVTLDDVWARMAGAIGADFAASSVDELFSEPSRLQLHERWPGFLPD